MKKSFLFIRIIPLIVILNSYLAQGQKLPKIQKVSIYAPQGIQINGNSSEWNDTFQAYNNAVEIFYTLSNDDKNIYLTVKVKQKDIVDKIIRGGLTFTINRQTSKNDNDNLSVTYPVLEGPDMWEVAGKFGILRNAFQEHETVNINQLNELFKTKEKLITVTGIDKIPDKSISIYNTEGIRSASLFDEKMTYTYELALPLDYLKLPKNSGDTFNYQVKINAAPEVRMPVVITSSTPPPPPPIPQGGSAATDFRGKYSLAKKP